MDRFLKAIKAVNMRDTVTHGILHHTEANAVTGKHTKFKKKKNQTIIAL